MTSTNTGENSRQSEHEEALKRAEKAVQAGAGRAAQDPFRLRYHLMAPSGWMNDPNGLIHFKGEYHAFYQHFPFGDYQGPMYWGHAVSRDLVRWEHRPVALAPTEPYEFGSPEGGCGCWSGSAVEHEGEMVLFYTAHVDGSTPEEVQAMATSKDGIRFIKHPVPVIQGSPDGECFGFRDPKVWEHEGRWYMVIGSGNNGRGRALLYESANLVEWSYQGVAAESDGTQGDMWECPDLFPLGDKYVLIVSPMNMDGVKNLYMIGEMDFAEGRFTPESSGIIDDGPDFYAAQTMRDSNGRRILIAWMDMWGSKLINTGRAWYGALTLARELQIAEDGTLASRPVKELDTLRGEQVANFESGLRLQPDEDRSWELPTAFEWQADIELSETEAQELRIVISGAGEDLSGAESAGTSRSVSDQRTIIRWLAAQSSIELNRNEAGIGDSGIYTTALPATVNARLQLRLFVDNSSVELFINDGDRVLTSRIYPLASGRRLQIQAVGGTLVFKGMRLWKVDGLVVGQ
ncbi:glycoside hydrolase family 32 protein [Paenibacillus sp. PR3]|uniref:Sucrose-6-phosphate hydrolase n=1 Tax=Paenibacillus terricola TaxID=2763503 RepID=A0ABR8MRI6_9BACL|nr:glycoside hydrolase family 32 protein [Paenibacillus terricola]MBD3918587.1 glycoside hydrolase family 32 protein [Paenibacillus terricola]